jgi:hypothetical protein
MLMVREAAPTRFGVSPWGDRQAGA